MVVLDYQIFFATTTNIILLPILSFSLFIAYMNKRGFMEDSGFDKPVIGILIIGSLFGIFVDIPLILFEDSLLNINLGGALIPVIVAGVLIYRNKISLVFVAIGTTVVSIISYAVSRIEPGMGIVSEFPYLFLPAVGALLMALIFALLMKKDESFQISFAYSVGVLGTLTGADLVRIPELVDIGVLGSVGGAGAMDLVYLSGLIASVPLIFIYYFRHDYSPPNDPVFRAKNLLMRGQYSKSRVEITQGLKQEIAKAKKLLNRNGNPAFFSPCRSSTEVLQRLGFGPMAIQDYLTLERKTGWADFREARKDILTGILIRNGVNKRLNDSYTSTLHRFVAYLVDIILISFPFILFFAYLFTTGLSTGSGMVISEPVILAVISLATSVQFIYFTLSEWYFGTTVGKSAVGLKVLDDELEPISFVKSVARNSGRYADMILGFYFVSLILILRSPERKRIGDHIAGTRVVKTK